ncbi:MAG: NADH-quinone oxidoreductase subunit J [Proteobacteria bacterium]|nr:NADH-quinone oxidoreductase subunit J [Pseudomonadota bacterium]
MIEISELFFYFFTIMVLGVGCIVAFSRNLLRSAFSLFFVLFGVAGFYVLLGGDFIAIVQIMVYAGGVNVLLIFGTMLTPDVSQTERSNLSFQGVLAALGGIALLALLLGVLFTANWPIPVPGEMAPTTKAIGKLLLKEYVLPFEVISFLLLAAMVGSLVLVKKGDQR